jgi:WD40 repeat protein
MIWEVETETVFGTYRTPSFEIHTVAFSRNGKMLATSGDGEQVGETTLWDVVSGRERLVLEDSAAWSVAFSPDGSRIAVGGSTAKIFDTRNGALKASLKAVANARAIAFSPDGKRLLVGVKLWDIASDNHILVFEAGGDQSASFSPGGDRVVIAGWLNPTVVWDARSGQEIHALHAPQCQSVAYSVDGSIIATGSRYGPILIWNALTGEKLATLGDGETSVNSVAFSHDGAMLASAHNDGNVKLWEALTK